MSLFPYDDAIDSSRRGIFLELDHVLNRLRGGGPTHLSLNGQTGDAAIPFLGGCTEQRSLEEDEGGMEFGALKGVKAATANE